MKKKNNVDLYIKCITTGPGFGAVLFVFYSIVNCSIHGFYISLVFSLFYFSDKDLRSLFIINPSHFRCIMLMFFIVGLLVVFVFYDNEDNAESLVIILSAITYCKMFVLCKYAEKYI